MIKVDIHISSLSLLRRNGGNTLSYHLNKQIQEGNLRYYIYHLERDNMTGNLQYSGYTECYTKISLLDAKRLISGDENSPIIMERYISCDSCIPTRYTNAYNTDRIDGPWIGGVRPVKENTITKYMNPRIMYQGGSNGNNIIPIDR